MVLLHQSGHYWCTVSKNDIRLLSQQIHGMFLNALKIACIPAKVQLNVSALYPSPFFQSRSKNRGARLRLWIIFGVGENHGNSPHALSLLRARCERPRGCAADERDEVAPFHSLMPCCC